MNSKAWRRVCVIAVSVLWLSACDDHSGKRTAGQQLDSAIARTEKAGGETLDKTRELAKDAREKLKSNEIPESLKATGRSLSSAAEDIAITAKIRAALVRDASFRNLSIDIDTHEGIVTLRGTVPTSNTSSQVIALANSVSGVTKVDNQLVVNK